MRVEHLLIALAFVVPLQAFAKEHEKLPPFNPETKTAPQANLSEGVARAGSASQEQAEARREGEPRKQACSEQACALPKQPVIKGGD